MNSTTNRCLAALLFTFFLKPIITMSDVIIAAGNGWCPYICVDPSTEAGFAEKPGIFSEVVIRILADHGHSLKLASMPWSRAILETRNGKYNAVFGSSKSITPDFIFPAIPQVTYNMCFHTRDHFTWQYTGINSLESVRLGIVQDYPYDDGGEVDQYIKQNTNNHFIQVLKGDDRGALLRNIQKLATKRVDAIIDSPYVINHTLQTHQLTHKLKIAGCLKTGEMSIAFSPALSSSKQYARLITEGMIKLQASGDLERIQNKYRFSH
ncbi:transporter substrate-binding domain-containing protein [Endozoicomonas sp. SM1973]|uniref:Transporter substrate-binding domain-containing protein n=1 Tax=Spartinivicinus marinus TaxID=2994442 RepID=A0A853HXG8_9GAMM|nr:transporter substrate-binding domain-containing protein [Spartinivicinus marinus]MCX4029475.1 transporter substrate-binding domain-containing protein [Spartinivicinus marinus]NYZ65049.1 transporter substrate-binding domain-containing protein [Spartinivicinus marinus]